MKSFPLGITGHNQGALDTAIEKGRQVVMAVRAPGLLPVWISVGVLAGVAAVVLRRHWEANMRSSTANTASGEDRLVADVMVTEVQAVGPDATVLEVARLMRHQNVGVLPIVQDGKVIGVITDRDLVVRALARDDIEPSRLRVIDCATRDPVLGHPNWMLERALLVMAEQQIGRLPIVDDDGRLVGLVTLSSVALRSQKADAAMVAAKKISRRSARTRAA
jgi:CBS domain-containing protein